MSEVVTDSRTERATVTLTAAEKAALRLVSAVDELDESSILRERTVAWVVKRAKQIRELVS